LKRWHWIEDGLLPLSVALLHTSWWSAWVQWSAHLAPQAAAQTGHVVERDGPALFGAFGLTRWLGTQNRPVRQVRALLAGSGIVSVVGALAAAYGFASPGAWVLGVMGWGRYISPAFVMLIALIAQWAQGARFGQQRIPADDLQSAFVGGLAALALLFMVNQWLPSLDNRALLTALLVTFGAGLSGLAFVSAQAARRQHALPGQRLDLSRYWLGGVGLVIALLLLMGLWLGYWLTPDTCAAAQAALGRVFDTLLYGFAIAFAIVAAPITYVLVSIINWLIALLHLPPLQLSAPNLPNTPEEVGETLVAPNPALPAVRDNFVVIALLLGAGLIFWFARRRFVFSDPPADEETRASVFLRDLIAAQLRRWWPTRAAPSGPAYLPLAGAEDDARRIARRAYQALLIWATASGWPRPAGSTPQAFAHALRPRAPAHQPAIAFITHIYEQARYAPEAPALEAARRAEQASAALPPPVP
jgi:hypothetical protein